MHTLMRDVRYVRVVRDVRYVRDVRDVRAVLGHVAILMTESGSAPWGERSRYSCNPPHKPTRLARSRHRHAHSSITTSLRATGTRFNLIEIKLPRTLALQQGLARQITQMTTGLAGQLQSITRREVEDLNG